MTLFFFNVCFKKKKKKPGKPPDDLFKILKHGSGLNHHELTKQCIII